MIVRETSVKRVIIIVIPFSVSFQTMPSSVTVVPGSQGPRQSGSVTTPTWHASTLASLTSCSAGHAAAGPASDDDDDEDRAADDVEDDDDDDAGGIGELAASHCQQPQQHTHQRQRLKGDMQRFFTK